MWTLMLLLMACRGDGAPDSADTVDIPVGAWEDAVPTGETISGGFTAELGSAWPGAGWFESPGAAGVDLSRASIHSVEGARWPVVQVQLLGHTQSGWNVVEIDAALSHWLAGEVPLDGSAAVGILTRADGSTAYLLGGSLMLAEAGVEDGQRVSGHFTDVTLAAVP